MFLKKSSTPEMMDDFSINDERIRDAIGELHTINRFLGGIAVTKKGIEYFLYDAASQIKILDIGGGGSDILYDLDNEFNLNIYSLDLNKYSCHYQKSMHPEHNILCADALNLPLKARSFDIIHVSLFLHHFSEEEIIRMLKYFLVISRKGIIINDLRRNILAYTGIRFLTTLFSRSTFVKNDGPISVRRAFTRRELVKLLYQAGINNYTINRMWAFRFLVVIPGDQNE